MKHHILIAPHGDDEIIGCYQLLCRARAHQEIVKVFYPMGVGSWEQYTCTSFNLIPVTDVIGLHAGMSPVPDICLHAPDPHFETHPEHRHWGMYAERLFRDGNVGALCFYSTIMNAPYIFEVSEPQKKRQALDDCYPSKSSLWKYDHKFFLFEGSCRWMNPNQVGKIWAD